MFDDKFYADVKIDSTAVLAYSSLSGDRAVLREVIPAWKCGVPPEESPKVAEPYNRQESDEPKTNK